MILHDECAFVTAALPRSDSQLTVNDPLYVAELPALSMAVMPYVWRPAASVPKVAK